MRQRHPGLIKAILGAFPGPRALLGGLAVAGFLWGLVKLSVPDVPAIEPAEALRGAANRGDLAGIERALNVGADVNAADEIGVTPLIETARAGRLAAAKCLLRAGANVNANARGYGTPLIQAAVHGHSDVARLLLAHGADPCAMNDFGNNALFFTTIRDDEDLTRLLLSAGARPNDLCRGGQTPLQTAHDLHATAVERLLQSQLGTAEAQRTRRKIALKSFAVRVPNP